VFESSTRTLFQQRKAIKSALQQHSSVLELLEIPQLLDTCIRNGYYDESLKLIDYTNRLASIHLHRNNKGRMGDINDNDDDVDDGENDGEDGDENDDDHKEDNSQQQRQQRQQRKEKKRSDRRKKANLIEGIVAEVSVSSMMMLGQLLSLLSGSIQLPQALRVVGHLRALQIYNEAEIRICFLRSREAWFHTAVAAASKSLAGPVGASGGGGSSNNHNNNNSNNHNNEHGFLIRYIDLSRTHFFEIISQFSAIFSDDEPAYVAVDPSGNASGGSSSTMAAATASSGILHSWIVSKVGEFLHLLSQTLKTITSVSQQDSKDILDGFVLQSLVEETMHYGMALSKVGCDFRPVAAQLFETAIIEAVDHHLSRTCSLFTASLAAHKWRPQQQQQHQHQQQQMMTQQSPLSPVDVEAVLMEHLPLAIATNHLLLLFNQLRQCALLSLRRDIGRLIHDVLVRCFASILPDYYQATFAASGTSTPAVTITPNEKMAFKHFCHASVTTAIPYIVHCVEVIFTPSFSSSSSSSSSTTTASSLVSSALSAPVMDKDELVRQLTWVSTMSGNLPIRFIDASVPSLTAALATSPAAAADEVK
jgi:hypothetical protein